MSYLEMDTKAGQKRKRAEKTTRKSSKIRRAESSDEQSLEEEILELEAQVLESRKHYNNIPKLLALAKDESHITAETVLAAVALCRIYCRLFANNALTGRKETESSEGVIVRWLRERLGEYAQLLSDSIRDGSDEVQSTALTLAMRLVKEQVNHDGHREWTQGMFGSVMKAVISARSGAVREEFVARFFSQFNDIRVFALTQMVDLLSNAPSEEVIDAALEILVELESPTEDDMEILLFAPDVAKDVGNLVTSKKQRKVVQAVWLAILKSSLTKQQNKQILGILVDRIVTWFNKVELLMDYLTDSFNVGGATSLLALSGLFHLMQQRNLDYPSLYEKLYSLLDDDLLHSKHRSRFFRLLDVFMGSTHLPAALVASFIKRLSRLALYAPPAGIVVVVPWIYNMFRRHPQCTFMIHRTALAPSQRDLWAAEGFRDPFDSSETDPMETNALESSIWEIVTLQNHWHPNVATLARIVSEPFTKANYNLEDFLDHSYQSLLDAELGKEIKKTPVVEWEIPKHVFLGEDGGMNELGTLMQSVLTGSA